MILQWFAESFYNIFTKLLGWLTLPKIDDNVVSSIEDYISLIVEYGESIFTFFVPSYIYKSALILLLAIVGFKYGYYLVMWILKKIPMVGIN